MRPIYRLVPDFIVPHLNNSTYGDHLLWEDKKHGSFKISRIHQSSEKWNENCIEVYKAWSLKKNHWNARDPKRITKAKHRLITALRRSPEIEMLKKEDLFYRFRIVHQEISGMKLNQESSIDCLPAISAKSKHETNKYLKPTEDTESCFTDNVAEDNESNINLTHWPHFQPEINDAQKEIPTPDYNFTDEVCFSEMLPINASDKCCCTRLLDTYLRDQTCIWHGIPP